jgi:hypothetical protein
MSRRLVSRHRRVCDAIEHRADTANGGSTQLAPERSSTHRTYAYTNVHGEAHGDRGTIDSA